MLFLLIVACILSSCASFPSAAPVPPAAQPSGPIQTARKVESPPAPIILEMGLAQTDDQLQVIASATALLGQLPNAAVVVKGKRFTLDCIGTVGAIFFRMDIDVTKDFGKYPGNGVNRLYMTLKDRGVLNTGRYPRTGDIIIWDNTWDANGDGDRTNDPRTHAGIVLAVDDDGTIHYVHENMYKGVVVEMMNLLQPNVASDAGGKRINSGLAIATKSGGPKPERWLAGDVFDAFGDLLLIKDKLIAADAF